MLNLSAQTNLFRIYPQPQPVNAYLGANMMTPIKTTDGGYIFSCNPADANIHGPLSIDYITIKTNSNFIPQWKRRNFSKIFILPSGGIISIHQNYSDKAYIDKQTLSGQVVWSKEIKGPNTFSNNVVSTSLSDGLSYSNKFRIIGSTFIQDFNGLSYNIEPYTAELDTATGNLLSAFKLSSINTSTVNSSLFYFNNLFRDAQGSFYLTGTSKAGLVKFSPNFIFMWQLSWINSSYEPKVTGVKFTSNGDLFCSMNYYDAGTGYYAPGIMRVSNPATILFEKKANNIHSFSGIENMPSGNFIFSFMHKQSSTDTLRPHLLATDGSGNILWCKSYHESIAVSPPLNLGNGEYLLNSMSAKTNSIGPQNPIAFTIDQNGYSSCTNKTINISLSTYSSSPVLSTVMITPITLTITNSATVNVSSQSFKDTCGGNQLGIQRISELESQIDFNFSPNPAINKINLNSSFFNQGEEVYIINLAGQVVKSVNLISKTIDLSGLQPGIYCIQFYLKNQIILSKKLVISREN